MVPSQAVQRKLLISEENGSSLVVNQGKGALGSDRQVFRGVKLSKLALEIRKGMGCCVDGEWSISSLAVEVERVVAGFQSVRGDCSRGGIGGGCWPVVTDGKEGTFVLFLIFANGRQKRKSNPGVAKIVTMREEEVEEMA
ncbi:hypothetical protein Q3G72_004522 [Acer saccharum]|nr:hypothetical protein Q3G72_004522 [Acer saccharum]